MFTRMSKEWRSRQDEITEELASLEKAARIYVDEGIAILDLCQRASELFRVQASEEKRRLGACNGRSISCRINTPDPSVSHTWNTRRGHADWRLLP
jgi:hypothetical protein